jgi:hypothetical protein
MNWMAIALSAFTRFSSVSGRRQQSAKCFQANDLNAERGNRHFTC